MTGVRRLYRQVIIRGSVAALLSSSAATTAYAQQAPAPPPPAPAPTTITEPAPAPDTAPLEAFALDFGDITAAPRPRGPQAPSSVTGHPNYAVLSKLFAHRVIGAGVFEVKTVVAEEALPPAATAEDAD